MYRGGRGRAEIADALVGGRDRCAAERSAANAGALVIEEDEQLVLDDGGAGVAAKLILDVLRLSQPLAIREKVVGVELPVAQILIGESVHLIRPALGHHADGGPRIAAVLG